MIASAANRRPVRAGVERAACLRIERAWAMPNKWTFAIRPIAQLLARYVGDGKGWIDPFAGEYSPAELTNDLNPKRHAGFHMLAEEFCAMLDGPLEGVLFDPPYSFRQVKECYEGIGFKVSQSDTQSNFYARVMDAICGKIQLGGYAISFGWNNNGFGKKRGFEIREILLVAHGAHHNDTIVTVEVKSVRPVRHPKTRVSDRRFLTRGPGAQSLFSNSLVDKTVFVGQSVAATALSSEIRRPIKEGGHIYEHSPAVLRRGEWRWDGFSPRLCNIPS